MNTEPAIALTDADLFGLEPDLCDEPQGPPDQAGRAAILRRYLSPIADFDVRPIVAVTDGATGADLRETVRRAVVERGGGPTPADLLDVVRSGRWKPDARTGQYL